MDDEKKILIKLGSKVRYLRKLRKMSQEKLAFKANLDRSYLGRIERAECSVSIPVLFRISRALKADIPTLFSFDKPEEDHTED